jgi:hypothetical protein
MALSYDVNASDLDICTSAITFPSTSHPSLNSCRFITLPPIDYSPKV